MNANWYEERITLQEFPKKFTQILAANGWNKTAQFRAVNGQAFAEVHLFESFGSDGDRRKFGLIFPYAFDDAKTFDDNRFIPETSRLATLGYGDGVKRTFDFPAAPMVPGSEQIMIDGTTVPKSSYVIDPNGNTVTFNTAPAAGQIIKANYALSNKAYEPSNVFGVFLYNDVLFEKSVVRGQPESNLGTADGTTKTFLFPKSGVRPGSVQIYVNNALKSETEYTIDYATSTVTFVTAPTTGKIEAVYKYAMLPVSGVDYGDLISYPSSYSKANGFSGRYMAEMAYGAITFVQPSPVAVMQLTNEANFSRSFQRDSFLYLWGSINKDRLALFFRPDPSADPKNALYVPLYLGRISAIGEAPRRNTVLIGGAQSTKEMTTFNLTSSINQNLDYGTNTANGNSYVLLHQAIGGSYYQRHYLSFITHSRDLDLPETRFNPSAYTGKYHLSQLWIVHPQEGYVGKLDDIYAVHPKNIEQMDELEIERVVSHETIGIGDGERRVFHIDHACQEAKPQVFIDCTEITTFIYDPNTKAVIFNDPPAPGVDITANYSFKQTFKYSLPTTERTPMRVPEATPFAPIGWAILKENTE
ncbi:hypothetical protein GFC29_3811 (plasmid) [Anoxybacillus sp. B7M1]|uniref:hypothetical protein n=1 Tax=Anoxybacillus sp. B7M1 TaxID=1490057 RepID=UPI0005CD6E1C|nr:hypothetical protein [Anoxybacillus sp. B7M1]ANB66112.1 hypothetical protein GFC29_3811 [Anoxybacillus sp. B7M1]